MELILAATGLAILVWILLEAKTSRPDGELVQMHPYRRLLAFITPGRDQATVNFDTYVDADPLLDYLEEAGPALGAHVTHAVVAACLAALIEVPRMNRFVVGKRLYQRNGSWITFSMKRRRLDRSAKISMVKICLRPGETFRDLCERINGQIDTQHSDATTREDREYNLFYALPRAPMAAALAAARFLDTHNLLPGWFIKGDPLFTSAVVANLGSLGMGAAYHHLYEWGTCPLFLVVGAIEDRPVVEDGAVVIRKQLHLRWSYDERIDDGLNARFGIDAVAACLSHPREALGCLAPDGSDARALDQPWSDS